MTSIQSKKKLAPSKFWANFCQSLIRGKHYPTLFRQDPQEMPIEKSFDSLLSIVPSDRAYKVDFQNGIVCQIWSTTSCKNSQKHKKMSYRYADVSIFYKFFKS